MFEATPGKSYVTTASPCPLADSAGGVSASLHAGPGGRRRGMLRGHLDQLLLACLHLRLGRLLRRDELVPRVLEGPDDLVELDVNGAGVPVLAVLNDEHH